MKVRFVRWLGISFMVAGVAVMLVCLGIAFSGMREVGLTVGIVAGPGLIACAPPTLRVRRRRP